MKPGDIVVLNEEGKSTYIKRLWDKPITVKTIDDNTIYGDVEDFRGIVFNLHHVVPHTEYYQEVKASLEQMKEEIGLG